MNIKNNLNFSKVMICPLCQSQCYPLRVKDIRDKETFIYGWRCRCDEALRDSIPELVIDDC